MNASRILGAALVILLGLAGSAQAADFCITTDSGLFVIRGFKAPKPGKCKNFIKGAYFAGVSGIAQGSACTNTVGDTLRVGWTLNDVSNYSYGGRFDIPYPSLTGGTYQYTQAFAPNGVTATVGVVTTALPCATEIPIL